MGSVSQGTVPGLSRPKRRGRRVALVLLAVLALTALSVAVTGLALLGMRGDLSRGRDQLEDARRALGSGSLTEAQDAFDRAHDAFATAADNGAARLGRWVPILGNNVDAAIGLARAGGHAAEAGLTLTEGLASLPNGLGSLAPARGRLPIDALDDLAATATSAREEADAAAADIDATPASFLFGAVADARWEAQTELGGAADALTAAEGLLHGLPSFAGAGAEDTRRYLLAAENPAELRGTGGIWGAYAVLTFRDGRATFSAVDPIQALPDVSSVQITGPDADYLTDYLSNYEQFGGAGSWQNLNMTPDFPSAARAALGAYEAATGQGLDGLLSADPFALQAMMEITGPARVPALGRTIDAGDVVPFTTNAAYAEFDGPTDRKEVLGPVATGVFERFVSMDDRGVARVKALAGTAADGHLKVFTRDVELQKAFETAGIAGGLRSAPFGDLLGVTVNNAGANKLDFYASRSVSTNVLLGGDGEAISTTVVAIANDAPTSGEPVYVLGPKAPGAEAGDQISLVSVSCHHPCELVEASRDGSPIGLDAGSELGVPWYRDYRTIPAGTTGVLSVTTRTSGVWDGNGSGGVYRLTYLGQTTIAPTELRVSIEAPEGTRIVWTSEPMEVDGATAVWEGIPGPRTELEVRFSAPFPERWWRNLARPFGGR